MELSEQERKIVDRLRRQQGRWRFACGYIFFTSVILLLRGIQGLVHADRSPWSLFLIFMSFYGFWFVAVNWHGRPEVLLLLKCLDASASEAEQRTAGDVRNARA